MLLVFWEYQVRQDRKAEFEHIYGSRGAWAELFRKAAGYLGTDLVHHSSESNRYMTIDRWVDSKHYGEFLSNWKIEYDRLDAICEDLTEHERALGKWETISTETR